VSQLPFFRAVIPFTFRPDRLYRVYVTPEELLFVRAGSAAGFRRSLAMHFGVLGLLIAAAFDPSKKNKSRQEEMDSKPVEELIGDHKHNFRVSTDGIEEIRLDPPSFWYAAIHSSSHHSGIFRLTHREHGRMRLVVIEVKDMKVAVAELSRLFGNRLDLRVYWSERDERFRRRSQEHDFYEGIDVESRNWVDPQELGTVCRACLRINAVIIEFGPQTPCFWLPSAFGRG
jgi:hypothetical protein